MKSALDKFSCFLTGFNYPLISTCSEIAKKMLKRYAGLLVLISIVWAIVGYSFATRYLKATPDVGAITSMMCVLAIIIIERNIILAPKDNRPMFFFRFVLGFIMAIIGSLIIDQMIFSEDIEEQRISVIQKKVNDNFPIKSQELQDQIESLNEQIIMLEGRRSALSFEIGKMPTIQSFSTSETRSYNRQDSTETVNKTSIVNDLPNPKINELSGVQELLTSSYQLRQEKDSLLLKLRADLQTEYENRRGFLEELTIMYSVVSKSILSSIVYFLWFLFFLSIELFILFSKIGESENDYHKLINQQMDLHNKRLDLLQKL
jgi:hypothetical protein